MPTLAGQIIQTKTQFRIESILMKVKMPPLKWPAASVSVTLKQIIHLFVRVNVLEAWVAFTCHV